MPHSRNLTNELKVRDIQGTCQFPPGDQSQSYPVYFGGTGGSFHGINNHLPEGKLSTDSDIILAGLLDEPEIILEISCRQDLSPAPKQSRAKQIHSVTLTMKRSLVNIIIYGRSTLLEDVGSFFEEHDIHLQHPEGCQMIVPYNNPHKLPTPDEKVVPTSDLGGPHSNTIFIEEEQRRADLLDELTSQHDLAEAEQPPSIRTELQK
jgi:SWI/SNF-related matrix-associated actin-dependent regulator of chromatin subfamily A3